MTETAPAAATTRKRGPRGMKYARISVPDLRASVDFYAYHVGLQVERHTDEYAYLRADIDHHNLELVADPTLDSAQVQAVGFDVESAEVLADLKERVVASGREPLPLHPRMDGLCDDGFAVRDPNGLLIELFTEFVEYAEPPLIALRPVDLVHPFVHTDRYDETVDLLVNVLGFLPSDYIVGSTVFLRCEDRYHHSFAVRSDKEYEVAHLCWRMQSLDHVMRNRARALYRDAPIASDLVNHSASTSIAFYLHDERHGPRVEMCDGHRILTPEEHETHRARKMVADPRNIDVWRAAADDWGRF